MAEIIPGSVGVRGSSPLGSTLILRAKSVNRAALRSEAVPGNRRPGVIESGTRAATGWGGKRRDDFIGRGRSVRANTAGGPDRARSHVGGAVRGAPGVLPRPNRRQQVQVPSAGRAAWRPIVTIVVDPHVQALRDALVTEHEARIAEIQTAANEAAARGDVEAQRWHLAHIERLKAMHYPWEQRAA